MPSSACRISTAWTVTKQTQKYLALPNLGRETEMNLTWRDKYSRSCENRHKRNFSETSCLAKRGRNLPKWLVSFLGFEEDRLHLGEKRASRVVDAFSPSAPPYAPSVSFLPSAATTTYVIIQKAKYENNAVKCFSLLFFLIRFTCLYLSTVLWFEITILRNPLYFPLCSPCPFPP